MCCRTDNANLTVFDARVIRRRTSSTEHPADIRSVSDTALWVAMYRALESERADALFHDPLARELAGARGAAILRAMPFGEALGWTLVVRTRIVDDLILERVQAGVQTVLNLGAGLDTRAFRLDLPPSLRWFDIDLPAIVEHRVGQLRNHQAVCRHAHVSADLTAPRACRDLLARIDIDGRPILIVCEGLLVYLTPRQVTSIAAQLHGEPTAAWWITDVVTPWLATLLGGFWESALAVTPFRFAPAEGSAFFAPYGWREAAFRSTWEESIRLGRTAPFAGAWTALGRAFMPAVHESMRRMSGVTLLERT